MSTNGEPGQCLCGSPSCSRGLYSFLLIRAASGTRCNRRDFAGKFVEKPTSLLPDLTPAGPAGLIMCTQCRNPVCDESKCLCSRHFFAREASEQCQRRGAMARKSAA